MPKNIQKFAYLLGLTIALQWPFQAVAVSIDDISIEHVSDGDRIVLSMDDPIRLKYEMRASGGDFETDSHTELLIHLPSGVEWNAPTQGQGSGLIQEYMFQGNDSGGGDLRIRTNQPVRVKRDGSNAKGYFLDVMGAGGGNASSSSSNWGGISFASGSSGKSNENKPLQVKNIRVGMKGEMTRIVLDLTVPTQFTIEQSMAGDKLTIKPQEPIEWNGAKKSFQSEGLVQGFQVMGSKNNAYLEVQTESGTAVQSSIIKDPNSNSPKYVIDLLPNNLRATSINKLFSNSSNFDGAGTMALGAGVVVQPVTSVGFEVKDQDTFVTIHLSKAQELQVIDNIYTHQVIISLPKVDWNKVVVPLSAAGLIKDYKVDQSLPDKTSLVLNIEKAAGVIGKRLSAGGVQQGASFTVVLSTNNAKVPAWLSELTVEKLPYGEADKKDRILGTRALKYRGGALEYGNIGEGFYLTALAGQLAGSNTIASAAGPTKANLSSSLMGISSYLGMGYGIQIERNYFGLEALMGYQTLLSKSEFTNVSGVTKVKNTMGLNWLVAGRAGYYTSPASLLYGKIGVASSTFNMSGSGPDNTILYNANKQILRSGFLFGVGVEAAIDDQLSARIETNQTTYQPFKSYSPTGITAKFHPRVQEMLIGISWKPSPMGGPVANDVYEDSITSGIYVGGEAGLGSMTTNRKVIGTPPNKYNATSITIEPLWGMYGGYAHNMGRYYVAGEGQIGFNQSNISESRTNAAGNKESLDDFLRWSLALTGRFGYIFNHGVIGYGRVGVVASRFSPDGRNNTGTNILTVQKKGAKTLAGLRIGGGLEIFLQPSLSLRGDYTMDLYPPVSIKGSTGSSEKVVASRNEFKLGLAYTFPVHK